MRPVNLLPESSAPRSRLSLPGGGNAIGYAIVGALVAVLIGVLAMVHFSNQIGEKQDEVAALEATEAEMQARAASLAQFTNFQMVREAREQTITALAESRFDWERVMHELSLVLPERVWLTNLTGTVSPDVTVEKAATATVRAAAPGPALQLVGCARSHRDVARLISALEDIDGVTRVTVEDSAKPDSALSDLGGAEDDSANTAEDCRTRDFVTQFHAVAAFDSVSVPEGAEPIAPTPAPTAAPTAAPAAEQTTTTASTEPPAEGAAAPAGEGGTPVDETGETLSQLGGGKQR